MNSLFQLDPVFPEGFSYFPDFITEQEEAPLCETISTLQLQTFLFRGYEAKRKVASYGYDYHFDSRSISKGNPVPPQFNPLLEATARHLQLNPQELAEVLVTEYPPGSVINWHRDAPPFDLIAGVSLLLTATSSCAPTTKRNRDAAPSSPFL